MKHRTIILATLLAIFASNTSQAQLAPEPFRYDLPTYFAGPEGKTWVGEASMFNAQYTDTVHIRYDAVEKALLIRRALVDDDDQKLVSYGIGLISIGRSDSLYTIRWTEKNHPEATGNFYWDPEYSRWRANFDGRWNQWFINIRHVDETSFEAGVARKVASFPAVELLDVTYHSIGAR